MAFSAFFSNFTSLLRSIGIMDILDILLVAVLFYVIFTRIRSTSAMRIAVAVALLLLITWVTDLVKLRMTNFLLSKILEVGFIALIIVFQPELRKLLERVGSRSLHILSQKDTISINQQAINKVVAACEIMSKEKTGVLLVFERDYMLDEFFASGTVVDAEVSTELLRNLFFTKASLHDGAVIIRGSRIAAAGCVLPLSESTSISSDLGTRHRAGIGMSEATDAVVVIVSEETGVISVAVGGMLKRGLSPETLRLLLISELREEEIEKEDTFAKFSEAFEKLRPQKKQGKGAQQIKEEKEESDG